MINYFLLQIVFQLQATQADWLFNYRGRPDCFPQSTPLHGQKWCNFTRRSFERGADCTFTCNKGYALLGANQNICTETDEGNEAYFVPKHGICERITKLEIGRNGPFFIYSPSDNASAIISVSNSNHLIANAHEMDQNQTTMKALKFGIKIPGLIGVDGTASLYLFDDVTNFLAIEGNNVVLKSCAVTDDWAAISSFWYKSSKFEDGFVTFSKFNNGRLFVVNNGSHLVMKELNEDYDKKRASFFLSNKIIEGSTKSY